MIVVSKEDWSEINVIRNVLGTMNDHGSEKTTSILCRVMAVVLRGPVQIGLEVVGEGLARGNRALLNRRHTIFPDVASLQDTVPVERNTLLRP